MAQSKDKLVIRHNSESEEELTFYWKIANFKDVYTAAKSSNGKEICRFPFTAGKSIGVPSNWEFHMECCSVLAEIVSERLALGAKLKFSGPVRVGASYKLFLKRENGEEECVASDVNSYPRASYAVELSKPLEKFGTLEALQQGGFLENGELQMKLEFNVSIKETLTSATEVHLKRDLSSDLKNGLETGVGADVTFVFVEEEGSGNVIPKISAHRLILSLRSPVFASMFASAASGMKEALKDGKVEIEDISPKAFGILLKFLYSGEVDEEWKSVAEELFYGADKYDLKALKKYLCQNVDSVLTFKNVWRVRELAKLYKLSQVLKSTMKFIMEHTEDFVENIQKITFKQN